MKKYRLKKYLQKSQSQSHRLTGRWPEGSSAGTAAKGQATNAKGRGMAGRWSTCQPPVRATAVDCRASASGRAVGQEATRQEAAAGCGQEQGRRRREAGAGAVPREAGAGAVPWEAKRDSPTREVPSRSSRGLRSALSPPCWASLLLVGPKLKPAPKKSGQRLGPWP